MKTVRCYICEKILGYSTLSVEYPGKFLCTNCAEKQMKKEKERSKSAGGLKTASGFIVIKNKMTFRDFGKKPKSRLDRFFIGLIEENYQPQEGSFFDRNCQIYEIENGEFLVKIKLPNGKSEYYLIKNDEIIDYYIEK